MFFCLQKRRGHGEHKGGLTGLFISEQLSLSLSLSPSLHLTILLSPSLPLPLTPISLPHHSGTLDHIRDAKPPSYRIILQTPSSDFSYVVSVASTRQEIARDWKWLQENLLETLGGRSYR